jgi:hypothetical protein
MWPSRRAVVGNRQDKLKPGTKANTHMTTHTTNCTTNQSTNPSAVSVQPRTTEGEPSPRPRRLAVVRRPAPRASGVATWVYREIPRQPFIERPEDAPHVPRPRVALPPQEPGYTDEEWLIYCGECDEYDDPYREIHAATIAHEEAEKCRRRRRR